MKIPRSKFKNNIRDYRTSLGLTQTQLADKVGVTKNTISALECNMFQPSLQLTWNLLLFFNIKFEDLFYFEV